MVRWSSINLCNEPSEIDLPPDYWVFIPTSFNRIVGHNDGKEQVKHWNSWNQLLCMDKGRLTNRVRSYFFSKV